MLQRRPAHATSRLEGKNATQRKATIPQKRITRKGNITPKTRHKEKQPHPKSATQRKATIPQKRDTEKNNNNNNTTRHSQEKHKHRPGTWKQRTTDRGHIAEQHQQTEAKNEHRKRQTHTSEQHREKEKPSTKGKKTEPSSGLAETDQKKTGSVETPHVSSSP